MALFALANVGFLLTLQKETNFYCYSPTQCLLWQEMYAPVEIVLDIPSNQMNRSLQIKVLRSQWLSSGLSNHNPGSVEVRWGILVHSLHFSSIWSYQVYLIVVKENQTFGAFYLTLILFLPQNIPNARIYFVAFHCPDHDCCIFTFGRCFFGPSVHNAYHLGWIIAMKLRMIKEHGVWIKRFSCPTEVEGTFWKR